MNHHRGREAAERFAERRRREDDAPRLREIAPELTSCRIDVTEGGGNAGGAEVAHVRTVIIERAPALFVVPCGDSGCRDGGYDITSELLRGFRDRHTEITGEDRCHGSTGDAPCGRVLKFKARATYEAR